MIILQLVTQLPSMENINGAIIKKSPTLHLDSLIGQAIDLMNAKKASHLVVVNSENQYIGSIKKDIINKATSTDKINSLSHYFEPFFIFLDRRLNLFDIYHLFDEYRTNILPVLNDEHHVLGVLKRKNVLKKWDRSVFIRTKGTIIEIEALVENYSISVLAQIIESNNAKILGIIILNIIQDNVVILIKTNGHNTAAILNDIRRYNYQVISYDPSDPHATQIEERTQYLNKYLDI